MEWTDSFRFFPGSGRLRKLSPLCGLRPGRRLNNFPGTRCLKKSTATTKCASERPLLPFLLLVLRLASAEVQRHIDNFGRFVNIGLGPRLAEIVEDTFFTNPRQK